MTADRPGLPLPTTGSTSALSSRQRIGLVLGPVVLVVMLLSPAPADMTLAAWRTAAVGALMATWWVTEALPIPVTALIPLILFAPLGILGMGQAAAPYSNPIIFLFLGGFVIALAMERWNLHRRIALAVVRAMGVNPPTLVFSFMAATAFLSMWVSNTATAVMMLPIGLSVIRLVRPDEQYGEDRPVDFNFAIALMLGIAYAASIGGLATLIGTPPNALLAGFMLESYGFEIGFAQWMLVGLPLAALTLPIGWLVLTKLVYPLEIREIPGGRETIERAYRELGPISRPEKAVAVVFTATAFLWITRPLLTGLIPGLHDTAIAVGAAVVLFMIPAGEGRGFIMDWRTAERLPWGVLILFGGGLSLAEAVRTSGLAETIGGAVAGIGLPILLMVMVITLVIILLTELTSNTATAAAFLPLVASMAVGLGQNPLLLAVPAALGASCAFMMPVATPPNAIVFGSGYVSIPQMVRAGWWLNMIFLVAITIVTYTLLLLAFGVELGTVPLWAAAAGP
jgi:solute carrier family 13 (sodium-dependent dicarboxylate transporter), member 2/3/5